jgi:cation:H+ antiporter
VPIAFSLFIAVAGFAIAVIASRWAVSHASQLAYGLAVPPFLIGITIVALGTDGPEIANSIVASLAGHGDLNVGNGIGSVFAQITFVLGLLPFAGTTFSVGHWRSAITPAITVGALGLGALLIGDGYISRLDGALLAGLWVAGTVLSWRYSPPLSEPEMIVPSRSKAAHATLMLVSLALVIAGAGAGVEGMMQLSREFGVPEYLLSFFGSSVGTSLPEIVVTLQAVRLVFFGGHRPTAVAHSSHGRPGRERLPAGDRRHGRRDPSAMAAPQARPLVRSPADVALWRRLLGAALYVSM